jgi:hypothetical protein
MVEVTQADMVAAEAQAKKHYQTAYDYEMDLREAFATHRQQAAKAERDRIVAWLRDDARLTEIEARRILGNLTTLTQADTDNWAKLILMKHGIADTLEKQP